MKLLLIGKTGQIGWELQRTLAPLGIVTALGREDIDLADISSIRRAMRRCKPDAVINAAAYTSVDLAEDEPDLALAVNGIAPGILAEEAISLKAVMIHYSTDYVFDGTKSSPYTEEDIPNPINIYGKTKLAGEMAIQATDVPHLIFRTSWVYGLRGQNFMLTILQLAHEQKELRVVNDQIGSPTWSRMIAIATALVLAKGTRNIWDFIKANGGVYHLTASGSTSWYGFARAILDSDPGRDEQLCRKIRPIASTDFSSPVKRPRYSVVSNNKIKNRLGITMLGWRNALQLALAR